ncbi:MAG TPA: hypothetical protein DCK95_08915 [Anaerolineaceae bacterium]|nr:hypothetical protein [Anaerolineaceae bacterium]
MVLTKERKNARFNITITESQKHYVEKEAKKMGTSPSGFLRELIEEHQEKSKDEQLKKAAELLAEDYRNDKELTTFTAIDGDPFL